MAVCLLSTFLSVLSAAQILWHGESPTKEVILTFDDGPDFSTTPKLLALLKKLDVKATFFLVGKMVAVNPSLARAIVSDGHQIGNHTYSHSRAYSVSQKFAEQEIQRTNDVIYKAAKVHPKYYRPSYGFFNPKYFRAIRERGMTGVFWSVDSAGYQPGRWREWVDGFCQTIDEDSIIMFHQSDILKPHFGEALALIVKKLRARGFSFVQL